ncbi:LysR substrate-binding domain-containing protein [Mycobacterium sp. 21AC1]|uniref:LysR substrate-binding domain-containing protein n=1 Tax=[Mycobacterium] appelbergii TaxID=2939269 RepID=UPI0029391EC1|nr:LysR substrate-binding domain-containing protein [Mycobacterium sp. 21AC1]MDV3124635.1 LysR substrate-binding domain-containing protein [Mycobacterium sp. 21AC1]
MSRTLSRLRRTLDDPVLVRAGRAMVPTPRALAMQGAVHDIVAQARAVFTPPDTPNPATLQRSFSIQVGEGLFSAIGSRLLTRIRAEAPGVTVKFVGESHEDTQSLRDGSVDIEVGQIRRTEPETLIEAVIDEGWVGVVRSGHGLATGKRVTLKQFAAAEHLVFSRRGRLRGPVDELLAEHGLRRRVVACAPNPAGGLFLIRDSDLVGMLPARIGGDAIETFGLQSFPIPLTVRIGGYETACVTQCAVPQCEEDGVNPGESRDLLHVRHSEWGRR